MDLPSLPTAGSPSADSPKVSMSKFETLKLDLPSFSVPKFGTPKIEVPLFSAPKFDLSKTDIPSAPKIDIPKLNIPTAPNFNAPKFDCSYVIFRKFETSSELEGPPQEERDARAKQAATMLKGLDFAAKVS